MARSAPIEAWWMYGIDRSGDAWIAAAGQNRGIRSNERVGISGIQDQQVALRDTVDAQRLIVEAGLVPVVEGAVAAANHQRREGHSR